MKASLSDDKRYIILTFRYDPRTVLEVKRIIGRAYESEKKRWVVPVAHVKDVFEILTPVGFLFDIEVCALKREYEDREDTLKTILSGVASYSGKLPLFDFQKIGASFIRETVQGSGVLLADVPGLGKTLQTLAAFEASDGPILVVVPASLKYSWADEIAKWTDDSYVVINGTRNERMEQWTQKKKWYIVNF